MSSNWCPVCYKQLRTPFTNTSLYCSESCQRTDALGCCSFHSCLYPDGSARHDHLQFCHHHRPAVRVSPSSPRSLDLLPSAGVAPNASPQGQEWMQFLQNQYHVHQTSSGRALPGSSEKECVHPCSVPRKHKTLPPPTLSPILVSPLTSSSSSPSPTRGDNTHQHPDFSFAWPKMEKLLFPEHCCRTSSSPACRPSSASPTSSCESNLTKTESGTTSIRKPFVSELPPPPSLNQSGGGGSVLSASIWGPGWHQVEPLPPSFVKTHQETELLAAQQSASEKSSLQATAVLAACSNTSTVASSEDTAQDCSSRNESPAGKDSDAKNATPVSTKAKAKKTKVSKTKPMVDKPLIPAVALSSLHSLCNARLPRSLQFIE